MKFLLSWLLDYLDTDVDLYQIIDCLDSIGFEVEHVEDRSHLRNFVVCEVVSVCKHPNSDRLSVCKVSDSDDCFDVVCGAVNVKAGLKTVLAREGAILPSNSRAISRISIRGIDSCGMLCSPDELGLITGTANEDEIIELESDARVGSLFFSCDYVLDVNVLPNMGHGSGLFGLARNLAACGIGSLKEHVIPDLMIVDEQKRDYFSVSEASDACVSCCAIFDIDNHVSTPFFIQERLRCAGVGLNSLVVDITNYVMLVYNRPLHAYDLKNLAGQHLTIEHASDRDNILALNGITYELSNKDLVIKDNSGVVQSVAGIIGSLASACSADTTSILLESAWFDGISVSMTSQRLDLLTDAAKRFERSVDRFWMEEGVKIAAAMIIRFAGGRCVHKSSIGVPRPKQKIELIKLSDICAMGSINISNSRFVEILSSLGFFPKFIDNNSGYEVRVPGSYPYDFTGIDNVVAEVLRIYGLDNVRLEPFFAKSEILENSIDNKLRVLLSSRGMDEIVNLTFMSSQDVDKLFLKHNHDNLVKISNPIDGLSDAMRISLLPKILQNIECATSRGYGAVSIFEVGPVYSSKSVCQVSDVSVAGARFGLKCTKNPHCAEQKFTVFDVKDDLLSTLSLINSDIGRFEISQSTDLLPPYYHPGISAVVLAGSEVIASFGVLHPEIPKSYGLKRHEVYYFEISNLGVAVNLLSAISANKKKFCDPIYPLVKRDFAFFIPSNTIIDNIVNSVLNLDTDLIQSVNVFDYYERGGADFDKLSIAFTVILRSASCTLSNEKISDVSKLIIDAVEKLYGGELRCM